MDLIKNDTKSKLTRKKGERKNRTYETVPKEPASKLGMAELVNPILNNYPGFEQDEAMTEKRKKASKFIDDYITKFEAK